MSCLMLGVFTLAALAQNPPVAAAPPSVAPADAVILQVTVGAQVQGSAGQRAAVMGVLRRATPSGSTTSGTAVVLDDGTAVFVSLGEPPAGWAWMLETRVRVLGKLYGAGTTDGPSVPTLVEPEIPMPADIGVPAF